jgi:hypothetical protein
MALRKEDAVILRKRTRLVVAGIAALPVGSHTALGCMTERQWEQRQPWVRNPRVYGVSEILP